MAPVVIKVKPWVRLPSSKPAAVVPGDAQQSQAEPQIAPEPIVLKSSGLVGNPIR